MSPKAIDMILAKLDEIHADVKALNEEKIPKLDKRIAVVEAKTKIWSGAATVMGAALGFLADSLIRK